MAKHQITKTEIRLLLLILAGIAAIFGILTYTNAIDYIDTLNPLLQFAIINLGVYLFVYIILKNIAMKRKVVINGSASAILGFISLDMILPEYHVSLQGALTKGGLFGASSSDYVFGYIGELLGITGVGLWLFVYVGVFSALMLGALYLGKNFVKEL